MLRGFVFFERSERNFLKHRDFDSFKEEDPELVKDEVLARFKEVYLKRSNVKATGEELAKHPINIFFEDVREGLRDQADTLKRAEAVYLKDLQTFAQAAYRRPLTEQETRQAGRSSTPTFAATRTMASRRRCGRRSCASWCRRTSACRLDVSPPGDSVAPLSDLALASRLSYFLWSSMPDEELLAVAKSGKLRDERVLREQVRRMLKDPKVSRFALEFFGQWFGYRDFLTQEAVNRQVFPAFDERLKQAMFEEPTRLIDLSDPAAIGRSPSCSTATRPSSTGAWPSIMACRSTVRRANGNELTGLHEQGPRRRAGHGRVPHEELPAAADQPGQARLLGGPQAARRTHSAAARRCRRAARQGDRHQRQDHPPVDGPAHRRHALRPLPSALRLRSACRWKASTRSAGAGPRTWRAGRSITWSSCRPGKRHAACPSSASTWQPSRKQDFTKTLCHKFLGYALGRSLQLSDQPLLEQDASRPESSGSPSLRAV